MKFKLVLLLLPLCSALAVIAPDFLPNDPIAVPELRYYPSDDGIYAVREGLASVAEFYPRTPIFLDAKDSSSLINSCLDFVDSRPDIFAVSSGDLSVLGAVNRLDRWWVTFAQHKNGVPVEGGRVDFRVYGSGRMAFCGANTIVAFESPRPTVSVESAIEAIYAEYSIEGELLGYELAYWPDYQPEGALGLLAWRIDIYQSVERRFRFYISAKTSNPLLHYSLVQFYDVHGTGSIEFLPKFHDDSLETAPFQFGNMSLSFYTGATTDRAGDYRVSSYLTANQPLRARLKGLWVDVIDVAGEDGLYEHWLRPPAEHDFHFSTAYADIYELNLYYHTTYIHEYFKKLDPPMSALDYPVPARAGVVSTPENAFWDGYATNYGAGGSYMRNLALFANIIYHEFGHGITGWLYEGAYFPYSGQSGAMNEAFSDYFAATNLDDPRIGYKTPRHTQTMFRTMDNNLKMPDDWTGQVHADGRIFGGALWTLRRRIEVSRADTIIHFTRYATPNTFNGFVPEALFTDDDDGDLSNGTPNCVDIFASFARHGIGPGTFPQLELSYELIERGDGDGFFEPGESLLIVPKVIADGGFAWPNIVNFRGSVSISEGAGFRVAESVSHFAPTIFPGDTSMGTPIVLEVTDYDESHFVEVVVYYEAMNITSEIADTFRLLVGFPQILIVDDCPDISARNLRFFTGALDEIGVTYHAHKTAGGELPANMSDFGLLLWFTGNDTSGTAIDEDDAVKLGEYLDGGGKVILTGQNMTVQFDETFLDRHFGAVHKDVAGALSINGIESPILRGSERIFLFGAPGAGNQRKPTSITTTRGEPIASYQNGDTCAVVHDNGISRTALFGFGLEAVSGAVSSVSLPELMARLMNWFDIPTGIESSRALPEDIAVIRVSPNPFNAAVKIEMEYPVGARDASHTSVVIFDISGRLVRSFDIDPTNPSLIWDGLSEDGVEMPSGTYLIRNTTGGKTIHGKAVLIR